MLTRTEALSNLLYFHAPMEQLVEHLARFPFDSEKTLVVLTPEHLRHVLQRYANGELTAQQVEDWANAIEGRDDIAFLKSHEALIEEAIFMLANPTLTEPITPESVARLSNSLDER